MGMITGQLLPYQSSYPTHRSRADTPSLGTRMFAVASAFLLSTSGALGALPPHPGRLQGGLQIPTIDGLVLAPVTPQFGPFLSPELSCQLAQMPKSAFEKKECYSSASLDSYVQAIEQEIPSQMKPYVDAVKEMTPVRNRNVGKFPENLSAFPHNKIGLVGNGNVGCILTKGLSNYARCKSKADLATKSVKEQGLGPQVYTDSAFCNKGVVVQTGDDFVSLGINPQIHVNYKHALDLATNRLVNDDCFFKKDPEEILILIRELHAMVSKDLPELDPIAQDLLTPGKFRTMDIIVYKDDRIKKDPESLFEHLSTKLKATKKEQKNYISAAAKMFDGDFTLRFTPAEKAVWEKLAYFPPNHREVGTRMQRYSSDLKHYAMREIHPIALAAWALAEFGRIHPFQDGNGRVGRIFMNALLVRGGYEPVVIPNDEDYTQALNDDLKKPGTFARYLAGLIKSQSKKFQALMHVKD